MNLKEKPPIHCPTYIISHIVIFFAVFQTINCEYSVQNDWNFQPIIGRVPVFWFEFLDRAFSPRLIPAIYFHKSFLNHSFVYILGDYYNVHHRCDYELIRRARISASSNLTSDRSASHAILHGKFAADQKRWSVKLELYGWIVYLKDK